ncbi:MAG: protein disulfide oxidoreductase [Candidatus Omnitrophota bacterium]
MKLLKKNIIKQLEELFKGFQKQVTVTFFTQDVECRPCHDVRLLLGELDELTDKIKVDIYDFVKDKEQVEKFGIKMIPAIVVGDEKDYGIRFYGVPGGYEFASLIEAIRMVSEGKGELQAETKTFLDSLDQDVHLDVFVTPTCPYCQGAVVMAHRMAYYSPRVTAAMVELTEYPELAVKYNIMGVPRIMVNEGEYLDGAAPEYMVVDLISANILKRGEKG